MNAHIDWNTRRNAQVIAMRRDNARCAVRSLREQRKQGFHTLGDKIIFEARVRELVGLYRATIRVCKPFR